MLRNHEQKVSIKIETYWNVNSSGRQNFIDKIKIKIETYWNVNGKASPLSLRRSGLK